MVVRVFVNVLKYSDPTIAFCMTLHVRLHDVAKRKPFIAVCAPVCASVCLRMRVRTRVPPADAPRLSLCGA